MASVMAHRGASAYAPENTMEAFSLALDMGAQGIELDVHLTKDNRVVVCHDYDIGRTSDGQGFIKDMTYGELKRYNFSGRFPGGAHRIPLLEEVLELVKGRDAEVNVELKSGDVTYEGLEHRAMEVVRGFRMGDRVLYSSFDHYALRRLRFLDPACRIGLLYSSLLYEPWNYARVLMANALHPRYVALSVAGFVDAAHRAGMEVNVWTVDQPEQIRKYHNMGVDRIITNVPDLALKIIREEEEKYE